MNLILVSIGGGFAAALLFAAVGVGSAWAGALSYLASLPVLIITLGWHQRAGLAAVAVAAAVLATIFGPTTALVYAAASGLPAWWIGFFALVGRSSDGGDRSEWLSTGTLLTGIVGSAALATIAGSLATGRLDYAVYRSALSTLIEALLRYESGVARDGVIPQVAGIETARLVALLVFLVPSIVAASLTVLLVVNTWLAAKIVLLSDRLPRPWPFLPATRMPLAAVGFACAGVAAAIALPGFAGVAGAAIAGAAGMGFAMQGLAFLHAVTTARAGRRILLGLLYIGAALSGATMLPVLTVLGLIDSATPVRRRLTPSLAQPD